MEIENKYLKELGINIDTYIKNKQYEYNNLDYFLITELYCKLRYYQDNFFAAPIIFPKKKWKNILEQIIEAIRILAIEDTQLEIYLYPDNRKLKKGLKNKKVKKGIKLFKKYFYYLWK